eukprot:CAMPEP_0118927960 /NCGR_PEP_ID=MMETSP1169-20130426/5323_1 /TAXON_ID=36882 /ORGANISM="Pyramimonas obovata, Strain CCMP722" /LENGTH=574 /DNA_ID=CAMNT_0006869843 /DNA_START=228 /DNA_END=1952 /DNA_ORIENTATION=+
MADTTNKVAPEGGAEIPKQKGPFLGVVWFTLTFIIFGVVSAVDDFNVLNVMIGFRSCIALAGYLIMQVGLWQAENKWDEEGSAAWLAAAGQDAGAAPETLEMTTFGEVTIPDDQLKASFPIPWGFLIGWGVWGISYLFPLDGTYDVDPSPFGVVALIICLFISFVASVPMSDAVMYRKDKKKKMLSLMFLLGWISLGIMSSLDVVYQLHGYKTTIDSDSDTDLYAFFQIFGYSDSNSDSLTVDYTLGTAGVWVLCMLGPVTIILSQKILFGARKMGTAWEGSGVPNFHPIVYNMGGPLFVWGWFLFLLGVASIPNLIDLDSYDDKIKHSFFSSMPMNNNTIGAAIEYDNPLTGNNGPYYIPLFCNWRTMLAFLGGCAMVPVVGFLDFSHDEDGPWCGENMETPKAVFKKWWLGTDGTYFGLFLESPWPFVMAWSLFGFSSFFKLDNDIGVGWQEAAILVNCILQGVDAGILIQQNLYAGNMAGKQRFSLPFVLLFVLLAINIGSHWEWRAIAFSLPGAILIILGQKTVFGARKRGDYTMVHQAANPYNTVYVYTWGEVFFMMGWILICWGMSFP